MKQFLIACLLLGLVGCGFTPLYATGAGAGLIEVDQIDGRAGHSLRQRLIERLSVGLPGIDAPGQLSVSLVQQLDRLALQPDEAATRTDVIARADYILRFDDRELRGSVEGASSFQVPDSPFADIPAQIDGQDRAMAVLAQRLIDDLRIKAASLE